VIIKYNNKIVRSMERIGKRIKRMGGTDFIQVTIKMDGK
jgi:hypothetical protein